MLPPTPPPRHTPGCYPRLHWTEAWTGQTSLYRLAVPSIPRFTYKCSYSLQALFKVLNMLALFIEMNGHEDKYLTENLRMRLWGYRSAGKELATQPGGLESEFGCGRLCSQYQHRAWASSSATGPVSNRAERDH